MTLPNEKDTDGVKTVVATYKSLLRDVIDRRPSGTRQRLADAIGKNRSFITQITNPSYSVPVPAQHLPVIFEICHFSPSEKEAFLAAYHDAHPQRLLLVKGTRRMRHVSIDVPDFGDPTRNRRFEQTLKTMIQNLVALSDDIDTPS